MGDEQVEDLLPPDYYARCLSGGSDILMCGPPGSGKTMLARGLPGILPSLTREESIEVTQVPVQDTKEPELRFRALLTGEGSEQLELTRA